MALAVQHLPGVGILAAHHHEDTTGEAQLVRAAQAVEHLQTPRAGEHAAVAFQVQQGRHLMGTQHQSVEGRVVGGEAGGVGHIGHLAQVRCGDLRNGAQVFATGAHHAALVAFGQRPQVGHVRGVETGAVAPDRLIRLVPDKVVFAALARGDDLEAQRLGPGHQADQQAWLVAVQGSEQATVAVTQAGQVGADHRFGFLGGDTHVLAGLECTGRVGGTGVWYTSAFHQNVEIQVLDHFEIATGDKLARLPGVACLV